MPFPADMIVNWTQHPVVNGQCAVCGIRIPSSMQRGDVAYEKQGRWLIGTPTKSEACTG